MRGGEGAEVVYSLRNNPTLAQNVLDEIGKKGQIKRKIYQRRLPENPSQDYYYIQRLTGRTEPILLEYGFIDNTNDARKLRNNLTDYVEGAVKAITEYAGYTYTPPGTAGGQTPSDNYYIVQRGDTLSRIASLYGITVNELRSLNNLTSDILQIGQQLLVRPIEENENNTIYIVERGDSLYSIAQKFNTTVPKIKELNNLTSNTLQIGQELIVSEDSNDEEQIENQNIYIVQRGDSLSKIANTFGVTVDEIKNANNLTSNLIMIGEELIIPDPSTTPNDNESQGTSTYTVKRGDTLYSIAALFETTVNNLIELNNLTSNVLQIGQELIVPGGVDTVIPDTSVILYTVEKGDSLWKIANNYNTTVNAIKETNNLTSDVLQVGQILQIPQSGLRIKLDSGYFIFFE